MRPDPRFWAGRPVCVTGGSGFLGLHLVRQLLALGARVRSFGLAARPDHPIHGLDAEVVPGDVCDADAVGRALAGMSVVFHAAGPVAASAADLCRVHERGAENVIAAARGAVVVHTSSVVAVGASRGRRPLDESSRWNLARLDVPYVHGKRRSELTALAGGAVVVNPGYLIGPGDHDASVMGRLCVRVWKGRAPFAPPGGFDVADVRDVATGHLLAAERGTPGRRYILGGDNLTQLELWRLLAAVAGLRPRLLPCVPPWLMTAAAFAAEGYARFSGKPAQPSLAEARVFGLHWFYSHARARDELGYAPRPAAASLADAFAWHDARPRGLPAWWQRAA